MQIREVGIFFIVVFFIVIDIFVHFVTVPFHQVNAID